MLEYRQEPLRTAVVADEHGSASKLRILGTILALLLLIEWPPEAMNLPSDDVTDMIPAETVSAATTPRSRPKNIEDSEHHIRVTDGT